MPGYLLLIGPLGTNFNEFFYQNTKFSFTKMHPEISSAIWWPFCLGGDELNMMSPCILTPRQQGSKSISEYTRLYCHRFHNTRWNSRFNAIMIYIYIYIYLYLYIYSTHCALWYSCFCGHVHSKTFVTSLWFHCHKIYAKYEWNICECKIPLRFWNLQISLRCTNLCIFFFHSL